MPRSRERVFATQRITENDIAAGTIRVPADAKAWFPTDAGRVAVVLKGDAVEASWDPRLGPNRQRSGRLGVGRAVLERTATPGEKLPIVRTAKGTIYVGHRGSRLRIAQWVNERPRRLDEELRRASPTLDDFLDGRPLEWLSPLAARGYRELADDLWPALRLPGPSPVKAGFWPKRGPNWDAVARARGPSTRGLVLVEAKSHMNEITSSSSAKDARSVETIDRAFAATKRYLGVSPTAAWTSRHYQVANRLAFLYYLRARRNIPAWLAFVYFTGDAFEVDGVPQPCPTDARGWRPTLEAMKTHLSLPECHALSPFVIEVFLHARPTT